MADELIDIVNEKDEVVGKDMKSQKRIKDFISRTVAIFIKNSKGQILVCKRGPHKKNDPNLYDLSAYGNVKSGEDYESAAKRELAEELGISCNLSLLGKHFLVVNGLKIFCSIFLGISDQTPQLNEELSEYKLMTVGEIEKEFRDHPDKYCPGFKADFSKVKDRVGA